MPFIPSISPPLTHFPSIAFRLFLHAKVNIWIPVSSTNQTRDLQKLQQNSLAIWEVAAD